MNTRLLPRLHAWLRRRWPQAVLILLLALALRLAPWGRYVTPDEPAWVLRAIRFRQALATGDLAAVPATGHPGVSTMWLGSAAIQLGRWAAPAASAAHLDWLDGLAGLSPQSPAAFRHLAFFLPTGRLLVAIATSLGLVGLFLLSRRLWGATPALLAALLLACDPFLTGHSGLLHLDGLLATTMTLSALAALNYLATPAPRWVALSGLLGGLALLTKTPSGFTLPFVTLLFLAAWLTRRLTARQAVGGLLLWGATAALTFLLLYPAMWADPLGTLRGLLTVGERHVEGALRPIFFHGQLTFDPPQSYYLVVWLFRLSPITLLGLLRLPTVRRRFDMLALLAMALGFGLLITLVGKKHDRYLLPAFPPLTLVAALGWTTLRQKRTALLSALVAAQLALALLYLPAPLGYYNPLLGGPPVAEEWLEIGWGEGLGAAARWLNRQPGAADLIVATPSVPPFATLFVGQTLPLTDAALSQADYIVYPSDQVSDSPATDAIFRYTLGGVTYARVVRNTTLDPLADYLRRETRPGDLLLLGAPSALSRRYDGPAEPVTLDDLGHADQIARRLSAALPGHDRLWTVALPAASPITARYLDAALSPCGPPALVATIGGVPIARYDACAAPASSSVPTFRARFGDALALVDAAYRHATVAWPDHLYPIIRWKALAPLPDAYAILQLKDSAGRVWAEIGQPVLDGDYRRPAAWAVGHWSDQTFLIPLPPALPPGDYTVELGVAADGQRLSAWDAEGRFLGLAVSLESVTVAPPTRLPSPWDMVIPRRFDPPPVAGPLLLWGLAPPPAQIGSGERVGFDLYWSASAAPAADYRLRWALRPAQAAAGLEETLPLSPYPTSRWREGELIQARYDLVIPPDLPPGPYTLSANVLDADGSPLWAEDLTLAQVEVLARDRLFTLPGDIAYPLDATLGTVAHLRGFDLSATAVRPGEALALTLYWQADGPADRSYTVFVHLLGADGMIHGQADHLPAGGSAPTHTWAPGQVVIDTFALPVDAEAPPGTYQVAVGLYDPLSGDRLSVYDDAGVEQPDRRLLLPLEVTVE